MRIVSLMLALMLVTSSGCTVVGAATGGTVAAVTHNKRWLTGGIASGLVVDGTVITLLAVGLVGAAIELNAATGHPIESDLH